MAFAGLNVTYRLIKLSPGAITPAPIYGPALASDNQTSFPATSAVACPAPADGVSWTTMASFYGDVNYWVTLGKTPGDPASNAAVGGRTFIPATTTYDVFCSAGDTFRAAVA